MRLKIKWNDDRVRGAATALLLIGRERLSRGEKRDLIRESLAVYRHDPDGYKKRKAGWADVTEAGPLTKPQDLAYYAKLRASVEAVLQQVAETKRQFNSLTNLDNFLITALKDVR